MRRVLSPFNVISLLLLLAALSAWVWVRRPPPPPQAPAAAQGAAGKEVSVTLYFSDAQAQDYTTERRTVKVARETPLATAQAALGALVAGPSPKSGGLRALPAGGETPQVWLRGEHAMVNLPAAYTKLNYGTSGEQMLLCSVVNTLIDAGVGRDVTFLVAGKSADTLLGHLDLRSSYTKDDCKT